MTESKHTSWFPRKKQGTGWGLPRKWQGWAVLLAYIFLSVAGVICASKSHFYIPLFLLYFAVLTLAFFVVVWKKGEKTDT